MSDPGHVMEGLITSTTDPFVVFFERQINDIFWSHSLYLQIHRTFNTVKNVY